MELDFIPISSDEEIARLAQMADEIWHEYWPGTLSYAQVDYMVEKFQSIPAITNDIHRRGYEYWILESEGNAVGYTGGCEEKDSGKFFISKIYLFASERGKGYASQAIRFYEEICESRNLSAVYLTVNKYNELGIRAYVAKGFEVIDSVVNSIGEGFVMDDFIMEKKVSNEKDGIPATD